MNTEIMFTPEAYDDPMEYSHVTGARVVNETVSGDCSSRLSLISLIRNFLDRNLDDVGKEDPYPLGYESATIFLSHSEDKKL